MTSDAMKAYRLSKQFKESPSAVLDEVNYGHVVAPFLYDLSVRGIMKRVAFALLWSTRIQGTFEEFSIAYSAKQKKRSDYDGIVDRLQEIVGNEASRVDIVDEFNPRQVGRTLSRFAPAWGATEALRRRPTVRLMATLLTAKYLDIASGRIGRDLKTVRRLTTFCDALPPENLLAQMAIRAGAFTATCRHGQYRVLNNSNMSADAEAYANFVSETLLCWGLATVREFERAGYAPERMRVSGWLRRRNEDLERQQSPSPGCFGVMLNGQNGQPSNAALLDLAEQIADATELGYVVRLHPALDRDDIVANVGQRCTEVGTFTLDDYRSRVKFSIAHMTGATVELLCVGSPVYLLDDGALPDVFKLPGLTFETFEDLAETAAIEAQNPMAAREKAMRLGFYFDDWTNQTAVVREVVLGERAYDGKLG